MPGEFDKLGTFIDRQATEAETEFIIAQLREIEAAGMATAEALKKIQFSFDRKDTGLGQKIKEIKEGTAALDTYEKKVKIVGDAEDVLTKKTKESTASKKENAEAIAKLKRENDILNRSIQSTIAFQKDGVLTDEQATQTIARKTAQIEKNKKAIDDLTKGVKTNTEAKKENSLADQFPAPTTKREAQTQTKALYQQGLDTKFTDTAKLEEINGLIDRNNKLFDENSDKLTRQKINIGNYAVSFKSALGTVETELAKITAQINSGAFTGKPLEELTKKQQVLSNATTVLTGNFTSAVTQAKAFETQTKNIGVVFGQDSEVFKTFSTQVAAGNKEVKDVSKSLKDAANGGNEVGTKIAAGASKAFGALRNLAYLIPGIGIGGIISLIAEPIIDLGKKLLGFGEISVTLKKQQEDIASAFQTAADNVAEEISKVTVLNAVLKSENATRLQKKEALKQLKDINYDYFGQLDIENGKIKGLELSYDAYINKLIASITAKANIEQLTQALKVQQSIIGNINKGGATGDGPFTANNLSQYQIIQAVQKFNLNFGADKKKGQSVALQGEQLKLIADLLNAELKVKEVTDKIKGNVQDAFNPKPEKDKHEANVKQAVKDIFDAAYEEQKRQQQRLISLADENVHNDKNNYDRKINALQNFSTESLKLIDIESEHEKQKLEEKLKDQQANLIKAKGTERNNLKKEIEDTNQRLLDIDNVAAFNRRKVFEDNDKKFLELTDKYNADKLAKQRELVQKVDQLANAERDVAKAKTQQEYTEAVEGLNARFIAGKISQKEYTKERAKLDLAYHIQALQEEIDFAKKLLAIQALEGRDISKQLEALAKLQMELDDLKTKHLTDNQNKIIEGLEKIGKISNDVFGVVGGIINANTITQKNALQEQQDAAEKKAQKDIEIVNASTDTEEKKAYKLQLIAARQAAQKEQFAKRDREIQLQQAKFEKAKTIFSISLKLAEAIASLNIYQAILAGAELAVAIATPLPKYFKGKAAGEGKDGYAMLDDGGKPEAVEHADGSFDIGGNRPRITWVNKSDTVHKDAKVFMKSLQKSAMGGVAEVAERNVMQENYMGLMMKSFEKNEKLELENQRLLSQIANKPVNEYVLTERGLQKATVYGNRTVQRVIDMTDF